MSTVREPAVAGSFYPAEPAALAATVDRLVDGAAVPRRPEPLAAMIVPHAGYVYSGVVAARAYRRLADQGRRAATVVVLGPNHTVPLDTIAVTAADRWRTPLGDTEIDVELRNALITAGIAAADDTPHRREHAIEVQLPFLQRILGEGWRLLPAVVGRVPSGLGGALVDLCWDADGLVVVSSDLSHYLPYDEAKRRDEATVAAIVAGDAEAIRPDRACGAFPVRALLAAAATPSLSPEILDTRNSGDTAGPRHGVVGYAAIAYHAGVPPLDR
jgi:AmmeMemoRadiSam system protein B